jgi:serine phosphatase RsbU (regulator of sigma subunit)
VIATAASLGGALIYFFTVAGRGNKGDLLATLLSTALWTLTGVVSGLLADAMRERSRRQREGAVALAQAEARQTAFADLEAGLLPRLPIEHDKLRVATAYRASESRLRLGGDFFDVMSLGGGDLALLIGDVSGHGPAAAALGTRLRAGWQTLVLSGASVHATLTSLNSQVLLGADDNEMFATACLAWVSAEPAGAVIACAGHPPPLLIADAVSEVPISPVLPLGIADPGSWQPTRLTLPKEWTLLFYTDGLIEGREQPGALGRYGIHRLMARLADDDLGPLGSATLERLTDEVEQANGGLLADDVAIVSVSSSDEPNE